MLSSRSRCVRSGTSIAQAELTKNSPLDSFLYDNSSHPSINSVPSNKWLVHRAFNPEMLGSRSRFTRSGASKALAESTRNNPQGCFSGVVSPLGSLWLSYKGSTSDCGSEDMGSIPIGHIYIFSTIVYSRNSCRVSGWWGSGLENRWSEMTCRFNFFRW